MKKYNRELRIKMAQEYIEKAGVSMFKDNPEITYEWLLNDLITAYVFCDSVLEIDFDKATFENDVLYIKGEE